MAKHRGEPVVKYEIDVRESERGWGQNWWVEEFDTAEDAQLRIDSINSHNKPGPAPDYYIQAESKIRVVVQ